VSETEKGFVLKQELTASLQLIQHVSQLVARLLPSAWELLSSPRKSQGQIFWNHTIGEFSSQKVMKSVSITTFSPAGIFHKIVDRQFTQSDQVYNASFSLNSFNSFSNPSNGRPSKMARHRCRSGACHAAAASVFATASLGGGFSSSQSATIAAATGHHR
jgi:hypothetical protein